MIHTTDEVYFINATIIKVEEALDVNFFCKIHQSFIVNREKIKKVDQLWVYLNCMDTKLPVSRRRRKDVITQLKD